MLLLLFFFFFFFFFLPQAGANMIVSGSAVVKSPDPAAVIKELREVGEKWLHAGPPVVAT